MHAAIISMYDVLPFWSVVAVGKIWSGDAAAAAVAIADSVMLLLLQGML